MTATEFGLSGCADALISMLKINGVKFLGIYTISASGQIHGKDLLVDQLNEQKLIEGVSILEALSAFPVQLDGLPPETGLTATNGLRLVGDLKTLRILPFNKKRAVMFGNFFNPDGSQSGLCPRYILQKQVKDFEEKHNGLSVTIGVEMEFTLSTKKEYVPENNEGVDETGHVCANSSHFAIATDMNDFSDFLEDAELLLSAQNVLLESLHGEAEAGQFEVVFKYSDPLRIAENIIIAKETLRHVSKKHNLEITFLPQPVCRHCFSNGLHAHLGLEKDGKSVFCNEKSAAAGASFPPNIDSISIIGQQFMAGILKHLPALSAVTGPSNNSFRRFNNLGAFVGNFTAWGFENKQVPLRVCSSMSDNIPYHFEFKTMDSTSNPFLALAALIACGSDGILNTMKLPLETVEEPSSVPDELKVKKGINRLPTDPLDAFKLLENDPIILAAMGKRMAKAYNCIRQHEAKYFKNLTLKDEILFLRSRGF